MQWRARWEIKWSSLMHTLLEMQKSDSWRDPEEAREGTDTFMRTKLLNGWKRAWGQLLRDAKWLLPAVSYTPACYETGECNPQSCREINCIDPNCLSMACESSGMLFSACPPIYLTSFSWKRFFGDKPCLSLKVTSKTLAPLCQVFIALDIWVCKLVLHMIYPQSKHFIYDFVGESNNIHARAAVPATFISFTWETSDFLTSADKQFMKTSLVTSTTRLFCNLKPLG